MVLVPRYRLRLGHANMNRGVLYYISGDKLVEPLSVSLWSLRRFYRGPVAIAYSDNVASAMPLLESLFEVEVFQVPELVQVPRGKVWRYDFRQVANKCVVNLKSPYSRTVRLDVDTLVEAPIDELFTYETAFVMVQPNDEPMRISNKEIYQPGRFRMYYDEMVKAYPSLAPVQEAVLAWDPPVINTGVYVVTKEHPFVANWTYLTLLCLPYCINEEVLALPALVPWKDQVRFLPNEWNAFRKTCNRWTSPKKIRHFCERTWTQSRTWRNTRAEMHDWLRKIKRSM